MQKHTSQSKVYKNMFVCLNGCLSQSLPYPLVCSHASVVLMWFVWLVDVLWVLLCVWYLCAVYVKWNSNLHTKHKEYNYFDILVGGGEDLQFDQVLFLDYFVYRAGNSPMIFLFQWKSYPWHGRLRVSFFNSRCALCICGLNIYQTLCNYIQNI